MSILKYRTTAFKLLASLVLIYLGFTGIMTFVNILPTSFSKPDIFIASIGLLGLLYLIMAVQIHFRPITRLLQVAFLIFVVGKFAPLLWA